MTIDEAIERITNKIAEWLEELKSIKENNHVFFDNCMKEIYNKAIDDVLDFADKSKFKFKDSEKYLILMEELRLIAEQLKRKE